MRSENQESSRLTPRATFLACGADLKGGFAVARGEKVDVFKGFGDLADPDAFDAWSSSIEGALVGRKPSIVAVDAHPLYLSHRHGLELAGRTGARLVEIQHHHAHAEAVLESTSVPEGEAALALVLDGTGYGLDGGIWGCEFLHLPSDGTFERLGSLRAVPCPGGDVVAREPWRMAVGWLFDREGALEGIRGEVGAAAFDAVKSLAGSGTPVLTSSAGRLFDAAAAILGLGLRVDHEAEAAMRLEAAAASWGGEVSPLPFALPGNRLDLSAALASLDLEMRRGVEVSLLAARFHATLVEGLAALVEAVRPPGVKRIVLAGGCFLNRILRANLPRRLETLGLVSLLPPPECCTDALIARGQIRAARARLAASGS